MKVKVGDQIPEWVMEDVKAERMRTMAAILRDPFPVHWDRKAVARMFPALGERTINQGPLGLSYILNMLMEWAGPTSVRRVVMRFPQVVLDGDRVTARGVVTAVREEEDGAMVADCDVWLAREGEKPALEGTATVALSSD